MSKPLVLAALLVMCAAIRVNVFVEANSYLCFYEHFYMETKYRFYIAPDEITNYAFELQYINDTVPKVLWRHEATNSSVDQFVNLHKFASEQGIHAFCVQNNEAKQAHFKMKLESGVQLMELDALPGASDSSLLESEIKLLQAQFKSLVDSLTSIQSSKNMTQQIFQLMSTKTFAFGMLGIGVVFVINALFYRLIKKTLQDRKRI